MNSLHIQMQFWIQFANVGRNRGDKNLRMERKVMENDETMEEGKRIIQASAQPD